MTEAAATAQDLTVTVRRDRVAFVHVATCTEGPDSRDVDEVSLERRFQMTAESRRQVVLRLFPPSSNAYLDVVCLRDWRGFVGAVFFADCTALPEVTAAEEALEAGPHDEHVQHSHDEGALHVTSLTA